ncbi:MAG: DUF2785 domain-containing protein [Bacilli bacterium]
MRETELAVDVEFLRKVVNEDGLLPRTVSAWSLIENFASPDAHLRDKLSYSLIAQLILRNSLADDHYEELLRIATDEAHLFLRIGETDSDSVFMRSFSVLLVPLVIDRADQSASLPQDLVQSVTESVLRYASSERDWRGYVPGKGWAHAVAHTADALAACALHPATTGEQVKRILESIRQLAMLPSPLGYLEDDRLAMAAFSIIQRSGVHESVADKWLDAFQLLDLCDQDATLGGANAEHFLRSLYFRFLHADRSSDWLPKIESAVARFDIFQIHGLA